MLSEEAWTLARLEAMLEDAPGLVHGRGEPLNNEMDLQRIMCDYLGACFPDFRPDPQIGGTIKNFKPDCGIASVTQAQDKGVPSKPNTPLPGGVLRKPRAGRGGGHFRNLLSSIPAPKQQFNILGWLWATLVSLTFEAFG